MHIAYLARELRIGTVYVPSFAAVFSALGMMTGGLLHGEEASFPAVFSAGRRGMGKARRPVRGERARPRPAVRQRGRARRRAPLRALALHEIPAPAIGAFRSGFRRVFARGGRRGVRGSAIRRSTAQTRPIARPGSRSSSAGSRAWRKTWRRRSRRSIPIPTPIRRRRAPARVRSSSRKPARRAGCAGLRWRAPGTGDDLPGSAGYRTNRRYDRGYRPFAGARVDGARQCRDLGRSARRRRRDEAMTATLDPIDFEVLRHRLWMINDEQGRVARPGLGFSRGLRGEGLQHLAADGPPATRSMSGSTRPRLSLCLNFAVKTVIERLGESVGIEEGDAFVTNDPWCGAAHMKRHPDGGADPLGGGGWCAGPGSRCTRPTWAGPNPGSFTVGTPDVFGEGPADPADQDGGARSDPGRPGGAGDPATRRTSEVNGLNLAGADRGDQPHRRAHPRDDRRIRARHLHGAAGRAAAHGRRVLRPGAFARCPTEAGGPKGFPSTMTGTRTGSTACGSG